jgi:hypothetical protein
MARPQDFYHWAIATFGPIATSTEERVARFLEEAIEVAHSNRLPPHVILRLVDRVYSREPGAMPQEIGQAQICLECLAESLGLSADAEADAEFARVQALPKDHWVQRQRAKAELGIGGMPS